MSVECHKDYKIVISSPLPDPVAWYAFESLDASGVVDAFDGYSIPRANITSAIFPNPWTAWTVVPGLVNNCYQTIMSNGVQGSVNPSPFDLSGAKSITVRWWFKCTKNDNSVFWNVETPCFGCRIAGNNAFPANLYFRCYLQMATTPVQYGDIALVCPTGTWHRVVFQFDQPNGQLGIQLDDNAMTTQTFTVPAPPFVNNNKPGRYFYILHEAPSGGGQNAQWDELTIWNTLLTPDQLIWDWNGGNGRTYPYA